jgi:hypothetical protein
MTQVIIYPNDNGGVAVMAPAMECGLTIEQIAAKDVPHGKPYQIVDASELPQEPQEFWRWKDED